MSKKVLVVDDNEGTLEQMTLILEKNGYVVTTAKNGQEGYDQTLAAPPDVILLDIMMPVMDGLTMNKQLKANPKTAAIPVIIVSARSGMAPMFEMETGAKVQGYLVKPVRSKVLIQTLEELFKSNSNE